MLFDQNPIHSAESECIRVFDFQWSGEDIDTEASRIASMTTDEHGVIAEPRENGGWALVKFYNLHDEAVRWALKPGAKRVDGWNFELHPKESEIL